MDKSPPLISIVVPCFNEEENIKGFHRSVTRVMKSLAPRYDYEFVFTDNHSTDNSFTILKSLTREDPRVRVFRFSKNFGYQRSIMTGFLKARGAVAVQLDCDLQDPPEMILEFVKHWEEGYKVVFGVRKRRKEFFGITVLRHMFYKLIDWLSDDKLPIDAGDFRLIDRRIIEELSEMEDAQPYLRGAIAAMGFKQKGIEYKRNARVRGTTKFSVFDLVRLALDGILNHSIIPLRIASFCGMAIAIILFLVMVGHIYVKLFLEFEGWPPGFTTLAVLTLFGISLNAIFLGIIGEYLARIYLQVKKRPLTIIEKTIEQPPVQSLSVGLNPDDEPDE